MPNFDATAALASSALLAQACDSLSVDEFITYLSHMSAIVSALGDLGFVAAEIADKVGVVTCRTNELRATSDCNGTNVSLQQLVSWELARGVVLPAVPNYVSAARSLLRLMWLLDFVVALLHRLAQNDADTLSTCARDAYDAVLAPRHPVFLRHIIQVALYMLPSRRSFCDKLSRGLQLGVDLDDALRDYADSIDCVRNSLWRFYTQHNITDLP